LLVTNKEKKKWIFPKGTVKKKETPEAAAEREAAEESGVRGRVVAHVGAAEYHDGGDLVRVDYFLVQCEEEKRMKEDRKKKWCAPEELVETLDVPELAELARRALPDIMRFK
jgi:8-oxo-dGTP pyrophosphatase MutT (NUDIX family)